LSSELQRQIDAVLAELPPNEQAQVKARLGKIITHRQAIMRYPTPGHIAQLARPEFLQTPMLDEIDRALMEAESREHPYVIINTPPQEGKTSRLQDGCAWMLLRDPTLRIAFASYEQGIASQSGLAIRQLIETHGAGYRGQVSMDREDVLGLTLDPNRAQQTQWSLAEVPGRKTKRPGGVISVGIGSSLTGRPVDVLVVDDPLKDAKQADSKVYRKAVQNWFQSVAETRMAPNGIVIVIQTRWHEDDLTGWLLAEDASRAIPRWRHVNIPAQAKEDDPTGRKPGEYLASARGRTPEQWETIKINVGSRWWFAMYQGDPSPPEGGTFQRKWFDKNRVLHHPDLKYVMTVVDPADNDGGGDEAGVVTGGLGEDGEYYVLEDNSGHYTVAGWVRAATFAYLRNGSSRIAYEKSLADLPKRIRAQWKTILRQARELARAQQKWSRFGEDDWPAEPNGLAVAAAADLLKDETDDKDEAAAKVRDLVELWPYVQRVLALPETGPPVKKFSATGSKTLRAELASPLYEAGSVHHVGHFTKAEHQMCTWLPTQDSPDRMDAFVHLLTELSKISGTAKVTAAKGQAVAGRQRPMPQIMRTTRSRR
jgi:hypothetical protein